MLQAIKNIFRRERHPNKLSEKIISFYGFSLVYSEGTSIVERFEKTGSYEQETLEAVKLAISEVESPVILDVGANIGFISLYALSIRPTSLIYAFEPGPHQLGLFRKTIDLNRLYDRIKLFDYALSEKSGKVSFRIHSHEDASGDGFVDTGRAGRTKRITVNTITIDQWWMENDRIHVDLVKMDTEGSELLILKGGVEFFLTVKPIVILEINEKNLVNYPYEAKDIFDFVDSMSYDILRLDGRILDVNIWNEITRIEDTFLLSPRRK